MEQSANQRLKEIRIGNNFSQEEFANEIGVSLSGYQLIEQGKRDVNTKILEVLNDKFGVSADWLLFGEKIPRDDLKSLIKDFHQVDFVDMIIHKYINSWGKVLMFYSAKEQQYELVEMIKNTIRKTNKYVSRLNKLSFTVNSEIADYAIDPNDGASDKVKLSIKNYFCVVYEVIEFLGQMTYDFNPVDEEGYDCSEDIFLEAEECFDSIMNNFEKDAEEFLKSRE